MYSKYAIALILAAAGANAQMDGIISSIAGQISAGLVSGRASGVPESQAASEVSEILGIFNANTDVKNLLSQGAGLVLGGINSDGVISLASAAKASISALENSNDGKSLEALISAHASDLDATKAFTIITSNLSPVLGLVLPQIASLSQGDQKVASAVNDMTSAALSLVDKYGLLKGGSGQAAASSTSAAGSAVESASSAVASASSAVESASSAVESATSAVESTASDSAASVPTGTAHSTVNQVNGQAKNSVQIVVAGAAVAAGLLFL